MLPVPTTGAAWVNILGRTVDQLIDCSPDILRTGQEGFNSLRIESLYCASTHAGAYNGIDFEFGQLIHRVAGPVVVMRVTVFDYFAVFCLGVVDREKGRRSKMIMNDGVQADAAVCWQTY